MSCSLWGFAFRNSRGDESGSCYVLPYCYHTPHPPPTTGSSLVPGSFLSTARGPFFHIVCGPFHDGAMRLLYRCCAAGTRPTTLCVFCGFDAPINPLPLPPLAHFYLALGPTPPPFFFNNSEELLKPFPMGWPFAGLHFLPVSQAWCSGLFMRFSVNSWHRKAGSGCFP